MYILDKQHRGKDIPFLCIVTKMNSLLMKLFKRILSISNSQKCNFLDRYKYCFGEISTLPKVQHITINQKITPVVTPARTTPISLIDKLKIEFERM